MCFLIELGIVGEPAGNDLLLLKTFVATVTDEVDILLENLTPEVMLKHGHCRSHALLTQLQRQYNDLDKKVTRILSILEKRKSSDAELPDHEMEENIDFAANFPINSPINSPASIGSVSSGRGAGRGGGRSPGQGRGGRGRGNQ